MEELINTLGQESEQYERLLDLSLKKTPVIVSADLEALALITDEEQVILSKLANIEKKREECMKDIANVVNRDVTTLKLGDLITMLSTRPQEQKQLAIIHDKLSDTIRQMRRSNEQNKQLIESSLELVQFDMNVIQAMKAAPETANYTKNAYASGDVMGVNSGHFDSKS
ncbi:MAG: flagellar protein FlgN [Lachnospiraceae bacterium]|jgi:flagellar biosynthesis/type III secretory pathway chaperone|nr:flagellar protein FlgN [Lachnospiraceae bacterium]